MNKPALFTYSSWFYSYTAKANKFYPAGVVFYLLKINCLYAK